MNPSPPASTINVATNDKGEPYIVNETALQKILRHVREGQCCIVLGPESCQKSLLLRDVNARLQATSDDICILLDLWPAKAVKEEDFLREMAERIYQELGALQQRVPAPAVRDELTLQGFLQDCVRASQRDLILLLDHLQAIRIGPLESLLRTLRSVHQAQSSDAPSRLGLVATSTLSVAHLSLGPTSPFNIAYSVWVLDLTAAESEQLILALAERAHIDISASGRQRLIAATSGDRYLLRKLCDCCAKLAAQNDAPFFTKAAVAEVIDKFIKDEAGKRRPLRATVRALENNTTVLLSTLMILQQGRVPQRQLPLRFNKKEEEELGLTGAIKITQEGGEKIYEMRNEIYARYLLAHFTPERVAYFLRMAGHWEEAITYLEKGGLEAPAHRFMLQGTLVDSIHGQRDWTAACRNLAPLLQRVFAIQQVRIYALSPDRSRLKLISHAGAKPPSQQVPLNNRAAVEVKAYFSDRNYEEVSHPAGGEIIYVPLKDTGEAVGLVCLHYAEADPTRDDFVELLAFLKRITRAIEKVEEREGLNAMGRQVTASLDLKQVTEKTLATAIKAVPGAQRGVFLLWEEDEHCLRVHAQKHFRPTFADEVRMQRGQGYVGEVFKTGKPITIDDAKHDWRVLLKSDPDIRQQESVIAVPLKIWERVIGVICLDNITKRYAFQEHDVELLTTFAAQAAGAVYNALLHRELYKLSEATTRRARDPQQLLQQVARSITTVTCAKGANILLLRDTDEPLLSVKQKPELSASYGLADDQDDYDRQVQPRADGLTFLVLRSRRPEMVTAPENAPGINPEALARGTRAYLCLPLLLREELLGVLFVHDAEPHQYSDNEIQMLQFFASHAALAIQSVRQGEELAMTKAVAWMGLVFSELAHRIMQRADAIRLSVGWLRRTLGSDPEIEQRLRRIEENALTVREIPSRALLPHQEQRARLDFNEVLQAEISKRCQPEDKITLTFRLAPGPPIVQADRKWLGVVLELLTNNALRALRSATQRQITISSDVRQQRVIATLTNTGPPIPPAIISQLFKEPVRKTAGAEGSGVGLLIARTIMRHYQGDLEFVSSDTDGTTFSLWLPLCQD